MTGWWGYVVFYWPLGAVGLWRWGVWLIKKWYASQYRPVVSKYEMPVSVVTPVYNEDPVVFKRALQSWQDNGVTEIVAVIDYTDERCIAVFKKWQRGFTGARLMITHKPGKRPALADGVRAATQPLVALVDSDTVWGAGTRRAATGPFQKPQIGGVATQQSVLEMATLPQRVFNGLLTMRYTEELPFMVARGGKAITCISGRTAFYRRAAILPLLDDLVHETFGGRAVVSGDDKRLTYLLEAAGWQVAWQQTAHVYTPGMRTWWVFLKQRLRWTRNSWRADLRTLTQGWVWRQPRLAWYLLDRTVQPFAQTLAPLFLMASVVERQWLPALIIIVWWHVGRLIRMWPVWRRQPEEIWRLPLYVLINFLTGGMKIYALVTLNRQGWMTRWHQNRLPQLKWLELIPGYAALGIILVLLGVLVWQPAAAAAQWLELWPLPELMAERLKSGRPVTGEAVFGRYTVQPGDSLAMIAQAEGVTVEQLLAFNSPWVPAERQLTPGIFLTIPRLTAKPGPSGRYEMGFDQIGPLQVSYEPVSNTIVVSGRGQRVTMEHLSAAVPERVREVAPREWYVTANIQVQVGVQLALEAPAVRWLKLKSTPGDFVTLRVNSGQLWVKGVKITSWDEGEQKVDQNYSDGRALVAVTRAGRFDAEEAELAYLGYFPPPEQPVPTYGVAMKVPENNQNQWLLTGQVRESIFHHNYYGAYAFGTTGMVWAGNRFLDNMVYGLDFYGRSQQAAVLTNEAAGNGRHGIVIAGGSERTIVEGNWSHGNRGHGLTLFEAEARNYVVDNEVVGNAVGIAVTATQRAVVYDNELRANGRGAQLKGGGNNYFFNNQLVGNKWTGWRQWQPPILPSYGRSNIVR